MRSVGRARSGAEIAADLGLLTHQMTIGLQRRLSEALVSEQRDGADDATGAIGPRHRAVLTCLDPEGTRAVEVARRSGQHKQVVGTLVDELERMGHVSRQPDPADRRAKLIVPTEMGRRVTATVDAALTSIESELAARLGADRYREFKDAFREVAVILSDSKSVPTP